MLRSNASSSNPYVPAALAWMLCALTALPACGGADKAKKAAETAANQDLIVSDAAPPSTANQPAVTPRKVLAKAKQHFSPLPPEATSDTNPTSEQKVALGRMLYHETRLSKNNDISCATCHGLDTFGVDGKKTSEGHMAQRGDRNAPTVYNAAFHLAQFWDGRAADLEEQAKGPILNPVEMAMPDEGSVLAALNGIPGYVEAFEAAFPGEAISYDNMAKAIATFERKLVTPGRFDEFLAGNLDALNADEVAGLNLFIDAQCVTCHNGVAVGGTMYQKLGNVKPWPNYNDEGRAKHTKAEADKYFFKVPSLRNIAKTGPYMHDGSVDNLEQMVAMMAEYQTTKGKLSDTEMRQMLAFLESLTGTPPATLIAAPQLPPDPNG